MRWAIVWVIVALSMALAPWARAAPGDPARAVPDAREGTTQLDSPRMASEPIDAPTVAPSREPSAVGDAPSLPSSGIRRPPIPQGFNSYRRGWVEFVYHPSIRERVQPLIAQADAARRELEERLGQPALADVRVEVARTPGEMATFAPVGAPFPEYAAGVAYPEIGLVLLSLTPVHPNSNHDLGEIFRHELAHVALGDAVAGQSVPRWFNEGFAVLASGETSYVRLQTLWFAALGDTLLPLGQMERTFPSDEARVSIAYAQAVDIVRFLVRRQEAHRFRGLIAHLKEGSGLERAVLDAYGVDLVTLEHEWRADVSRRYTFWPIVFSGTFVWMFALGLFGLGWRRRKRRDKVMLERWAREEAAEDALRRKLLAESEARRVHIVLARPAQPAPPPEPLPAAEVEVPRVEHEGQWHTLH
jgi:Peptidase MA superfamily